MVGPAQKRGQTLRPGLAILVGVEQRAWRVFPGLGAQRGWSRFTVAAFAEIVRVGVVAKQLTMPVYAG